MLMPAITLIAGLALLVWGAERFVEGAAATARHAGLPTLLVGLLVVGFGGAAPELAVATHAALNGTPALALGNAWGASLLNLTLILGTVALVAPLRLQSAVLRQELPLLLLACALSALLVGDGVLSRADAAVLLLVFAAAVAWAVQLARRHRHDALATETATELRAHALSLPRALGALLLGLAVLLAASWGLVWAATQTAQALGLSDYLIGLTVLALGTSLPELALCVSAARKGEHGLVLGQVLGSSLFNLLAVAGLTAGLAPLDVAPEALRRELPLLALLTLGLLALGRAPGRIPRWAGLLLLAAYLGHTGWVLGGMG